MKKLLVLVMAACMSLGVWVEAGSEECCHDALRKKWVRIIETDGGTFVRASLKDPEAAHISLSGDRTQLHVATRRGNQDIGMVVEVDSSGLLTVRWW